MQVTVVGLGAEGWPGLAEPSRTVLRAASVVLGGPRQLDLLPAEVTGRRRTWPSPMLPALPGLLDGLARERVVVLASGDPMLSGVGSTLVAHLGPDAVTVLPHVSSVALARARLGWAAETSTVVTVVGRDPALLHPHVTPGHRVLVLGAEPAGVAALLTARGYGASGLVALARLGADDERVVRGTAAAWSATTDPLVVVAVECVPDDGAALLPRVPGLPDDAFEHDGQLTKREVRAVVLSRLAPVPGQRLWDVGAGAGSIGVEWMRTHPTCTAVAVESHPDRADRLRRNASALGVPGLQVVVGRSPAALADLPAPDAVFVGGGLTAPGVLGTCLSALPAGGRLVATAVTLESETVLAQAFSAHGGDLVRVGVARARPVGRFTGWDAAMPVTVWSTTRGGA